VLGYSLPARCCQKLECRQMEHLEPCCSRFRPPKSTQASSMHHKHYAGAPVPCTSLYIELLASNSSALLPLSCLPCGEAAGFSESLRMLAVPLPGFCPCHSFQFAACTSSHSHNPSPFHRAQVLWLMQGFHMSWQEWDATLALASIRREILSYSPGWLGGSAHLAGSQRSPVELVQGVNKDFDALTLLQARKEGHPPHSPAQVACTR
jgi:hypothetical protein